MLPRTPMALAVALVAMAAISTGTRSAANPPITNPLVLPATVVPDTYDVDRPYSGTFPVFGPDGGQAGTRAWMLTWAGGDCCEVDVVSTPTGRLVEFGGTWPYYSDDLGRTWSMVKPATPLVNGEGAIVAGPNGDIYGIGWDTYGGDHLQAFVYNAETRVWSVGEVPVHSPVFDRPWITVARGPFTINGQTCAYATLVDGGYPAKNVELASCDGLTYDEVAVTGASPTTATGPLAATADPTGLADYWSTPTLAATVPLSGQGVIRGNLTGCVLQKLQLDTGTWQCYSLPGGLLPGAMRQDSRGWLTNITGQYGSKTLSVAISTDGGSHWSKSLTLEPPGDGTLEAYDVHVNGALGLAAIDARFDNAEGAGQDMLFQIDESTPTPQLIETDLIGKGDAATVYGLNATGAIRLDYTTVTITPDGTIVGSFDDSTTHGVPAMFVEQHTYRPDASIKSGTAGGYAGDNVYNLTGAKQTVAVGQVRNATRTLYLQVQNDGRLPDRFTVTAPGNQSGFVVHYFAGSTDVTSRVVNGSYVTGQLAPGATSSLRLVVTSRSNATIGSIAAWLVKVASQAQPLTRDVVKAVVTVAAR